MVNNKLDELKVKVVYIGDDNAYWEKIKNATNQYFNLPILGLGKDRKKVEFEFKHINPINDKLHYTKFILTRQFAPRIIYLDLSTPQPELFNLLKLIKDCELTKMITVICLFREETPFSNVLKSHHMGAELGQFKSNDDWYAIYNVYKLIYPTIILNQEYALAIFSDRSELHNELRIQYLTNSRLLLESKMKISDKKIVELEWEMDKSIIPNNIFKFIELTSEGSFYNYPFIYKYEPLFINKHNKKQNAFDTEKLKIDAAYENSQSVKLTFIDEDSDISPELILYDKKNNKLNDKYIKEEDFGDQELIQLHRIKLTTWINKHNKRTLPLELKVLVIDRRMQLLLEKSSFEDYQCQIRQQDYIKDYNFEIQNYKPSLIAIQLDNTKKEFKLNEINFSTIKLVIEACQKVHDYFPVIVLFNCPEDKSINIQHDFEYHQLIAHKGQINIKIIQLLIKSLNDKLKTIEIKKSSIRMKEYAQLNCTPISELKIADFESVKANFVGTEIFSSLWYTVPIEVISLSESEINFYSEQVLPAGTMLKFSNPILFFVSIIHQPKIKKRPGKFKYTAIIHSITHKRTELLRQYINKLTDLESKNGGNIPQSLIDTLKVEIKIKDK
jgi:hypothetical protein